MLRNIYICYELGFQDSDVDCLCFIIISIHNHFVREFLWPMECLAWSHSQSTPAQNIFYPHYRCRAISTKTRSLGLIRYSQVPRGPKNTYLSRHNQWLLHNAHLPSRITKGSRHHLGMPELQRWQVSLGQGSTSDPECLNFHGAIHWIPIFLRLAANWLECFRHLEWCERVQPIYPPGYQLHSTSGWPGESSVRRCRECFAWHLAGSAK